MCILMTQEAEPILLVKRLEKGRAAECKKKLVVCLVAQSCLFVTPWSVVYQALLSMETLQARILEWVAMPSSRGSSQPRDRTQVFRIAGGFFTIWATTTWSHAKVEWSVLCSNELPVTRDAPGQPLRKELRTPEATGLGHCAYTLKRFCGRKH